MKINERSNVQKHRRFDWLPDGIILTFMAGFAAIGAIGWIGFGPNPVSVISIIMLATLLVCWLSYEFPVSFSFFLFVGGIVLAVAWTV